jgi:Helix-turn-helix
MAHKLTNMQAQRLASSTPTIPLLAKKAGVHDGTIRTAENGGAISVTDSQRIADALGVSLATLGAVDHNGR